MKITKEFRICEVKATEVINAPFQIVLKGNSFRQKEESSLTLDSGTCAYYNIPMSLDLVGRILVCSFESRELPPKNDGPFEGLVDMGSLENDSLAIHSLKRSEIILPSFRMVQPSKRSEISQTLKLSSFSGGDGIHPTPLPCPFYRVILELTDEEYEACKALPPTSVFKASFHLA